MHTKPIQIEQEIQKAPEFPTDRFHRLCDKGKHCTDKGNTVLRIQYSWILLIKVNHEYKCSVKPIKMPS